jgi:hypothetical protein
MAVIEPIKLDWAPGLFRQNTAYSCPQGRWNDGNLMRMAEGVRKPMKGWVIGLAGTLTGNPRAAFAWKDNDQAAFAAFGTHSGLFTHDGTTLDDVTPDAPSDWLLEDGTNWLLEDGTSWLLEGGFNAGDQHTATWTFDNFGELLIACYDDEQAIYEWQPLGGSDASIIINSPDALAVVVTPERFILALGADGDPRRIAWPDGENRTTWTPTTTNRARELIIQTEGVLMCGVRVTSGTLIFTSHDVHFARYIGLPDVYSIKPVGKQCGIVGKHAFIAVDQIVYWMGLNAFWVYAGYAEPIQCEIADDVFKNINETYRYKVWCRHNAAEGEVWFYYPRGAATECSHVAIFCYRGQPHWNHIERGRNCGFDEGAFSFPVEVSSAGQMFKHEYGYSYSDGMLLLEDGTEWLLEDGTPWLLEDAEVETRNLISGPMELGNGGALLFIDEIIPDETTQGDCEVYFYLSEFPTDAETTIGPFSAADRIPVEAPARKVRMEIRAADGVLDFRVGNYRAVVREWSAY